MNITPSVARLNALINEFDQATGSHLDRVTNPVALLRVAQVWPGCRPGLAGDLARALDAVERENTKGER